MTIEVDRDLADILRAAIKEVLFAGVLDESDEDRLMDLRDKLTAFLSSPEAKNSKIFCKVATLIFRPFVSKEVSLEPVEEQQSSRAVKSSFMPSSRIENPRE